MRKNRSRLAMKKGLLDPMHKPNDFSKYKRFLYIGKNRSRLASKKGLLDPMHNLKDFYIFNYFYILFFLFLSLYVYAKKLY